LKGRHLLVCTVGGNLEGDGVNTIIKSTASLIGTIKEVCLEINARRSKYMLICLYENADRSRNFEHMENLKYLEMTLRNQNYINKEIKSRMYSRNACCHSYQDRLSSFVLSRNAKLIICTSINLPVVLCA
jgi:hypothetical protein